MIHRTPSTKAFDAALIEHHMGGRGIYKAELYIHATREALARSKGYNTWNEWQREKDKDTRQWWCRFMLGEFDD